MKLLALLLVAQSSLFQELRWRCIGPYRGGRTKSAAGVPQRPGTFYIGAVNGGVWKSDDYGRTWTPIFDDQPTGSIGALAVAPSNPDVIYAGSGEGMHRPDLSTGDGVYKSIDGGKTWRHLGLRDGQQIPQIAVDPRDPNRLFVAVLGHPYGPNEERGVFRSLDGGETFARVLFKDADTGAADVALDPSNPQIVYASLWEAREGPWENAHFEGPGSGLYKSTDGGSTWRQIGKGMPESVQRIGIGIAPSLPSRMFATVAAKKDGGLYRSDDAGETWARISEDSRVGERAEDSAEVKVHPANPDVVFVASVVLWKSVDGGKTFSAFRGAPGGDDYQKIWIDPLRPDTMLVGSDQGGIVTVNGGASWSSWYNQPTAQMFHVTADNDFPYRLCGGQQESGSACVSSRGDDGQITFREWHPAGFEEYGYAAPDPLDPAIVFGGKLTRWDRRTGQSQNVAPVPVRGGADRMVRTQPLLFADPHSLLFATNRLWKSATGGKTWTAFSPDLTRKTWELPSTVAKYREDAKVEQRGVVYTIAPSPLDSATIWAGTDDGLVHLTRDGGKTWRDVTPKELVPWAKVSLMDAGHFDKSTAYAAINTLRLDDLRPHIFRTHDGGKSWTEIVRGLPAGGIVNVVREDPRRKGLLFAGTEQAVYVSFDDGEAWQPLRLNMPATSIRDLIVKGDDLAVATHGRGFWILDDIEPLREPPPSGTHLFRPQQALRVRWNNNSDTPLPPDEPRAPNPPDGAVIDYFLGSPAPEVTLEILDGRGKLVRRYSSADPQEPIRDEGNVPRWWIRPAPILSREAGLHRFVWDLHYPAPAVLEPGYPIAAVPGNTPREPRGAWAMPGRYTIRLVAGKEERTQPLFLKMDPRVRAPEPALRQQFTFSMRIAQALGDDFAALREVRKARAEKDSPELAALEGTDERRRGRLGDEVPALAPWNGRLAGIFEMLQQADAAPSAPLARAAEEAIAQTRELVARWKKLKINAR
jgi:photosystem II stability/assembly factor-like uncharacterized protein